MKDDEGTSGLRRESGGDDDRLWRELAAVIAEASPVPPEVIQRGRDSFTWRTIDAELATLAHDSEVNELAGALVRAADSPRLLTFEAPGLTVEVEVTAVGARRRLIGQLDPPQQATVTVRHHQGSTVTVEADALGRFTAEDVPAGLNSLRCHLAGAGEAAVVTDWVTL